MRLVVAISLNCVEGVLVQANAYSHTDNDDGGEREHSKHAQLKLESQSLEERKVVCFFFT
jgi:hypothetical protein